MSSVQAINMIYHCWYWPWSPGWGSVYQVSLLWSDWPLFIVYSLEEFTKHSSHLSRGDLYSFSLWIEYLHKLFGILCKIYLPISPFVYLFNHLFISLWTRGCLFYTLALSLDTWLILLCSYIKLRPLGVLSFGFCVPLIQSDQDRILSFSFLIMSLLLRMVLWVSSIIRNQDLGARCALYH